MSDEFGRGDADRNDMNTANLPQPRGGRHRDGGRTAHSGLDDLTVERLLEGERVADPTAAVVSRVLDAAAAPAQPAELRNAGMVFAAYAAQPPARPAVRFGQTVARLLGVKLAAVIVAGTAVGGIALAASTGVLPTPQHPHPAEPHGPASPKPSAGAGLSPRPSPIPSPSAAVSIAGLCTAYLAIEPSQREKALATPGFAPLVQAAGAAKNVPQYCESTAAERSPGPQTSPSRHTTGKPSAHPSHPTTDQQPAPSPNRKTR